MILFQDLSPISDNSVLNKGMQPSEERSLPEDPVGKMRCKFLIGCYIPNPLLFRKSIDKAYRINSIFIQETYKTFITPRHIF